MAMDLTGINNVNEYYTHHYLASVFESNVSETISAWRTKASESDKLRTPWSLLRDCAQHYYVLHDKSKRARNKAQILPYISEMASRYLTALGYPEASPFTVPLDDNIAVFPFLEMKRANGAPLLWVLLSLDNEYENGGLMNGFCFDSTGISEQKSTVSVSTISNEELISKVFFSLTEPPRWLILIGENSIVIVDRNKWNEKRYLEFDLDEIFSRREETTFQAMAVLLHRESLCPDEGESLLDKLDENSHKHASGVSQNLKYALRECIELLGNEVLYDMSHRLGRDLDAEPVDAAQLTLECLRYMYRMLFVLFIEARPELGYAPMKAQAYVQGYSLESLRDVADSIREETSTVGEGYFLHESLSKLFELIYNGYPEDPAKLRELQNAESLHDMFILEPLKAHIFDPDFTPMISGAKLRNRVMLRIIDLMSVTRSSGRSNERRGRISYSNLGINQMGAVYEALLSYRGFIAEQTLYEVKRERDEYDELDVGYFVPESELENYTENERARYPDGRLRKYEKGTFIYRLAGREREKSASYYTPEVLTKCLVKYALKELLEGKTADEILQLTVCEPAMGSAAFLNEVINQLAEAYLDRKQKELGHSIPHEKRFDELQRVKMYIADRNVYGIDLNPVAVELAEVSLWLNTIFSGGFVPWFNTHLVCGNSLIGARRQCYDINQLKADRAPAVWYENEPERIVPGGKRNPKKQVYHFLTGDPGMSNYTDRIIQSLAPDDVRQIRNWNRKFTSPFSDGEIKTVLRLSETIDELWEKQIKLRREIDEKTSDPLSIFGQHKTTHTLHTTIREKDMIYRRLYKSEEMNNAGPYARLKFAMDYWCALWFWPIDKAELLPTRSEFLVDMSFILEGTIDTFRTIAPEINSNQLTLFPSEAEQLVVKMSEQYEDLGIVDIPKLCEQQPRLALVREIAKQQRFLHWELEFADLFAERGGFDLIIGNPPWIKMEWNEQAVLSDRNPMFAVKALSAAQTARHRDEALKDSVTKQLYFSEYESLSSIQSFINATQNYAVLKGQQANLYRCFLPQAWSFGSSTGVSAFLHPDGVYDDPKGGTLREQLYPRLRRHFQFTNELKLFAEVDHHTRFSLNIYRNATNSTFDTIANLFDVSTIEQCYDNSISGPVPGIKDENDKWNVKGHPERLVRVGKRELAIFAKLFDGNYNWKQARLPVIHAQSLIDVLYCFSKQEKTIGSIRGEIYGTEMWHETNAQNDGTILRNVHFPDSPIDMIYSGPHIGVANPIFKCSRAVCRLNSDYDNIDLTTVPENYLQRCNYSPACDMSEYMRRIPTTPWGEKYNHRYSISSRKMLNLSGERTLISAITPKNTAFIHGLYGMIRHGRLSEIAGTMASVPFDFYLKIAGKANGRFDIFAGFPVFDDSLYSADISIRLLLLNCLSVFFAELWREELPLKGIFGWSKSDPRLRPERFTSLTPEWTWNTPLRTDYERRQALVEIDVLTAMALGMTLEQLKTIYRIQFPVLRQYESDTWYDANGRIVFTNNRSLTGVGFPRSEFEPIKNASAGQKFYRTVIDDTMPVGPIERTIEYVAPFDRCDREQDYETAWRFFAEKYGVWHD
jgi:hypothetical protein